MQYFLGLVLALALGVMGCSETSGMGGSGGTAGDGGGGGDGGAGGMTGQGFPCTKQGIIESPRGTCGFDQTGDQRFATTEQLKLGPLQDNGGPTETHALGEGSVAIDAIPAEDCVDADGEPLTTDQRGVERPQGGACDVGAVEMGVTP